MHDGRSKALISLGGNLAVAMPDPDACFAAVRGLDLSVNIVTKFNRTCLLHAKETLVLPCLGRTELDLQAAGPQWVTVEDSMSMVHASRGKLQPPGPMVRSEPAIVAGLARAALPQSAVDWEGMTADYDHIRDGIEAVYPNFHDFNLRVRKPGGFRLTIAPDERVWKTESGKAQFIAHPHVEDDGAQSLLLTTIRSHDQYNTTIYSYDDRYRGVTGRRDVIFANEVDLEMLGLEHGDRVDVTTPTGRTLKGYTIVRHAIARGSLAAYYPEANCLVPLGDFDPASGTPAYKSIPVTVTAAADPAIHPA
jgi:molybdopterin-dependent oxidoreductase alpha subunit